MTTRRRPFIRRYCPRCGREMISSAAGWYCPRCG